jgi:hypothetical protein
LATAEDPMSTSTCRRRDDMKNAVFMPRL